jgi:carbon-monoxide dehydrogenase medium subunit
LKPPPFDYIRATTVDEALRALAEAGEDAKVLAGGQSLIPLLSLRLAHPTALIDINRVSELSGIERSNGELRIGATTRHRAVERSKEAAVAVPLLAEAMPLIGHLAIRSRGTIGGSLAHADPAAELPAVATALDATFTARSAGSERSIPAADFFQGYFTTSLEPDEILVDVRFPAATGRSGFAVEEVARRHGDFAMVGAVAAVTLDDASDTIADVRSALINVADKAVRATAAEQALAGTAATITTDFAAAAAEATRDLDPSGDLHASPAYRRKVAAVCVRRALERATRDALDRKPS